MTNQSAKPDTSSPWKDAAADVISVLLQPERRADYEYAVYERGLTEWQLPPSSAGPWRALFAAIDSCYRNGTPLHDTTVIDAARGRVKPEEYHQHFSLFDALRGGRDIFRANISLVIEKGTAYSNLRIIEDSAADLRAGRNNDDVVTNLIANLGSYVPGAPKEVTITQALAHHEAYMSSVINMRQLMTHNPWWDGYTGGIRKTMLYWIAAAYKSRKSSILRNLIIGLLDSGASLTFGSLEGDQNRIVAEFKVMLACQYLLDHNLYHDTYRVGSGTEDDPYEKYEMRMMSSSTLTAMGNRYRTVWPQHQIDALDWATEKLASYGDRLRIHDSTKRAGRLLDMKSVRRMIIEDKTLYGADVICIDYLQRIKGNGSIYERVSNNALELQDMALSEDVGMIILAQLNEESIRSNNEGWSSGVKGGGDVAASADYLVTSRYMIDDKGHLTDDDQHVALTMKYSRHGVMGPKTRHDLQIDAWTGLLIPPKHTAQFYSHTSM